MQPLIVAEQVRQSVADTLATTFQAATGNALMSTHNPDWQRVNPYRQMNTSRELS